MATDERIESELKRRTRFGRLLHVVSCDSTQALATAGATGSQSDSGDAVFWADHQTGGRGRQERVWHDDAGLDLAATFRVTMSLPSPTALPAALPVVVLQACEPLLCRPLRIKWPNDVLLDGQKLSGVLVDRDSRHPNTYRIGIGINVNRTRFPSELEGTATSLALLTGKTHGRGELLLELAERMHAMLQALTERRTDGLETLFRERLGLLGERVEVDAGEVTHGELTAIDFERLELDDSRSVPLAIVRALRLARE